MTVSLPSFRLLFVEIDHFKIDKWVDFYEKYIRECRISSSVYLSTINHDFIVVLLPDDDNIAIAFTIEVAASHPVSKQTYDTEYNALKGN